MRRNVLILTGLICVSCGGPSPTTSKVCPRRAGARQTSATPAGLLARLQARTHVVLLGTGTPNADPTRQGPALAVVVKGTPYLVDCGPGLVRRAAQANKKGIRALAVKNLGRVFLTHLHSDHTAGFPDLLYTPWVLGRKAPLQVCCCRSRTAISTSIRMTLRQVCCRHRCEPLPSIPYRGITRSTA